nr:reverse transcriptase domain-containing protein [Tanacetum cinerariifolium]
MDKIHHDKRKEVHARLDFEECSKERRIKEGSHYSSARTLSASPDRTGQAPRIVLAIEAALTGGTLLMEIVLRVENAPVLSRNHMTTPIPPIGPTTNIAIATETALAQKKYVKDPVEIHNIKKKDEEIIEDFMERFNVETGSMKGAHECIRISGFMHGVNNMKLTKRLNEHVPKTMEETMIATAAFIRGEAVAAGKKKGPLTHPLLPQLHHQTPLSSSSNTLRDEMLNSLHNISTILDTHNNPSNAYTQRPPSPPPQQIYPPSHSQVDFHSSFCHCCRYSRNQFHYLGNEINFIHCLFTRLISQTRTPSNHASPTSSFSLFS